MNPVPENLAFELNAPADEPAAVPLSPGACVLRRFALRDAARLLTLVGTIEAAAAFRHLKTPGGLPMSVAMTNCGDLGWVSDRRGYRYEACDPLTGSRWPELPTEFRRLSQAAAQAAGYAPFSADACLINRYVPGAKMSLHQDRDEQDLEQPIVSVSLGLPATFLWGGALRSQRPQRVLLEHGDVVVWGGPSRLHHHGVAVLKAGHQPGVGAQRINLTFRRAR
jgi:alkylated DNA repair protein (DNA oxidative demethylase)